MKITHAHAGGLRSDTETVNGCACRKFPVDQTKGLMRNVDKPLLCHNICSRCKTKLVAAGTAKAEYSSTSSLQEMGASLGFHCNTDDIRI